jgi:hypothetical protein
MKVAVEMIFIPRITKVGFGNSKFGRGIHRYTALSLHKLTFISQNNVAYLSNARTVVSKHFPRLRNSRRSGVFSVPSRTEPSSDESSCVICCQATAINTWITQELGMVT